MSAPIETVAVTCPYCGAGFETSIDLSAGDQSYYEDCAVCCAPIQFVIELNDRADVSLCARRDDE